MNKSALQTIATKSRICRHFVVLVAIAAISQSLLAPAAAQSVAAVDERWLPADFQTEIVIPGLGDFILRPSAVHFDRYHEEIIVADTGNNRIVVFSTDGVFKFDFRISEIMSSPQDIVTDPQGFIYVLGSSNSGRKLHKFDFDGTPMEAFNVPAAYQGKAVDLRSMACNDEGALFALDHSSFRILEFDRKGEIVDALSMAGEFATDDRQDVVLGKLGLAKEQFLVPVATSGYIARYGLDGEHLGSLGAYGSKHGFLNFPVAAEAGPDGSVLVLDKTRVCVVCYDANGKFVVEFGGMGFRNGWFYHPTLIAVVGTDKVVVGQIFENRIQICGMPDKMLPGARQSSARPNQPDLTQYAALGPSPHPYLGLPVLSYPFDRPIALPLLRSGQLRSLQTTTRSHLEVTE